MLSEQAHALAALLREMREQDGGFFPDGAWLEIHRNFALPYVEVVLTRTATSGGTDVFLARRPVDDPHWPGQPWHIPGGLWRVTRTLAQACDDVAKRETGVGIASCREVMTYKWPDHPYANPISHVCVCEPVAALTETAEARFFPLGDPPQPLLTHQDSFLAACHAALTRSRE